MFAQRIARILLKAAIVIVVLFFALYWLLPPALNAAFDFAATREAIGHEVRKKLGRELSLDGEIRFHLRTLTPGFRLTDVRLQNAAWGDRPDMLRLDTLGVEIRLLPLLLRDELDIASVELGGAEIYLERDSDGRKNWDFSTGLPATPEPKPRPAEKSAGQPDGLHWFVEELRIRSATITYHDRKTGRVRELDVVSVDASLDAEGFNGAVDVRYGKSDLHGDIRAQVKPDKITARLRSKLFDVDDFIATESRVRREARARKKIPQPAHEPLPFEDLAGITATIRWDLEELRYTAWKFQDLRLGGELREGRLNPGTLSGKFAEGNFNGSLAIDAAKQSIAAKFRANDLRLATILTDASGKSLADAKLTMAIQLDTSGADLAAVRNNLDGPLVLETGPVDIDMPVFYASVGSEAAGVIRNWVDPLPRIDCVIARIDVTNGVGEVHPFVFDTNELTVLGAGTVDLADNQLNLVFALVTKKLSMFSLASHLPVHLRGTFARPTIQVADRDIAKKFFLSVLELPELPVDVLENVFGVSTPAEKKSLCSAARQKAQAGLNIGQ